MATSRLLSVLIVLLSSAAPALAQAAPPAPEGSPWITVVIAIVLIVAVGVASFMSSKRTHQD